jgi:hypothetical protein
LGLGYRIPWAAQEVVALVLAAVDGDLGVRLVLVALDVLGGRL